MYGEISLLPGAGAVQTQHCSRRSGSVANRTERKDLLADYCCTLDEFDMGGIAQGVAAAAQYSLPLWMVNSSCVFRTTAKYSSDE